MQLLRKNLRGAVAFRSLWPHFLLERPTRSNWCLHQVLIICSCQPHVCVLFTISFRLPLTLSLSQIRLFRVLSTSIFPVYPTHNTFQNTRNRCNTMKCKKIIRPSPGHLWCVAQSKEPTKSHRSTVLPDSKPPEPLLSFSSLHNLATPQTSLLF